MTVGHAFAKDITSYVFKGDCARYELHLLPLTPNLSHKWERELRIIEALRLLSALPCFFRAGHKNKK